jgi:general secretion pathway protein G
MIVRKVERRPSDRLGFTLMEVLVVVAILVVLAGTASIFFFRYLDDSKKSRAQADVQTLTRACQGYNLKFGNYPESLNQLITPPDNGKPFLDSPENILDPWNKQYSYDQNGARNGGNKPDIWTIDPDGREIGNWTTRAQ